MILLSACLAGFNVRYDGGNAKNDLAARLVAFGQAVTVCPEVMGGMSTPREPAEIQGGDGTDVIAGRARVVNRRGIDVTRQYLQGAQLALGIARRPLGSSAAANTFYIPEEYLKNDMFQNSIKAYLSPNKNMRELWC
ncbi:DUF523 domain-containing protein [Limosilactobacillus sp.]|uniref:DUF523 domain-containing protein n=1 Tax=Limosilactobacillus sp. TaxID=2773925 RepID=UPI0035A17D32